MKSANGAFGKKICCLGHLVGRGGGNNFWGGMWWPLLGSSLCKPCKGVIGWGDLEGRVVGEFTEGAEVGVSKRGGNLERIKLRKSIVLIFTPGSQGVGVYVRLFDWVDAAGKGRKRGGGG